MSSRGYDMVSFTKTETRDGVNFRAKLTETGNEATLEALADLWSKVLETLPGGSEKPWEMLVCYISVETGDVLVYPTTMKYPSDQDDVNTVNLTVADWI